MALSRLALGVAVLTLAFVGWVLLELRSTALREGLFAAWMDGGLLALGLISLALLLPVRRALTESGATLRHLRQGDVFSARVSSFESRTASWETLGWAGAALIVAGFAWFVFANNIAVGKTFFNLVLIGSSFGLVLNAFLINITIFMIVGALVLVWGLVIAVARLAPGRAGRPIRVLATLYTDIFRGLPAIITIYLVGFGLPLTGLTTGLQSWLQVRLGIDDLSMLWAVIALTLTYGAYVSEVYRAGLESIHPSQIAAARSLGLSFGQTLRYVVIPQAVRRMVPPLLNNFIGLQKDTSLVNVIGTIDAFNQARIVASNNFNLSAVTTVALLFVLITIPQARFVDRLLERDAARLRGGAS